MIPRRRWWCLVAAIVSRGDHGASGFLFHPTRTTSKNDLSCGLSAEVKSPSPLQKTKSPSTSSMKSPWDLRIEQLQEYKAEYGDCLVPRRYTENPSLGNWVNKQRQNYRKFQNGQSSSLTQERIDQLDQIGFVWNGKEKKSSHSAENFWWKRFEELKLYKKQHGNTSVRPFKSPLGYWINTQRNEYVKFVMEESSSALTQEQVDALNSIQFDWKPKRQQVWDTRIRELKEYKQQYGDCAVPVSYKENPKLAHWVSNQRKQYNLRIAGKPSLLTNDRVQELEEIGFIWDRWEYEFQKRQEQVCQ